MKKRILILLLSYLLNLAAFSQECNLSISGYVIEKGLNTPLPFSTIYDESQQIAVSADAEGFFKISNLCPDEYHFEFSHIGCSPEKLFINLASDTIISIYLEHHTELLDEIVVHGSTSENSAKSSSSIDYSDINKNSNKSLSELLETLTGVSAMKNGSGISKPVIHGLYGNRIAILNNGVPQAGQQWGNDHAPEIDPSVADHISVVKGAGALAYGGNSLGGVVLVEPGPISSDSHLHGSVNYIFQTNGLGNTLNTRFEKNAKWASWRISGTLKAIGDRHSPDYFLTNTSQKEANIAVQFEKNHSKRWSSSVYYSLFNTVLGVLRGSHIGNLTDLQESLTRSEPFFTNKDFSYSIDAPYQRVQHHLLKLNSIFNQDDSKIISIKYALQLNNRKEYDVRRSGRSELPSLSLNQYAHLLEVNYKQILNELWILKSGLQFNQTDNANEAGTGVLPLIPRYTSSNPSVYAILQGEINKWMIEFGSRYDYKSFDVSPISRDLPRRIENFNHRFHNYAFTGGIKYLFEDKMKSTLNFGYLSRSPEVNELYSYGLHQGVSGLEEGNRNLNQERALKIVYSVDWFFEHKIFIQALGYIQSIKDYIYLQPQNDFRLTIRGAFPVFTYEQTDARIYGTDLQLTVEPRHDLKIINKYSMVRGVDEINNLNLINLPSDNISTEIKLSTKPTSIFKGTALSILTNYVWRQSRIEVSQDFLSPPDGYFLLGGSIGTKFRIKGAPLEVSLRGENLLNERYRDYLNRLRYFSNEAGRNFSLRLGYSFAGN